MPIGNILDLSILNDNQKRLARYARAADVRSIMGGGMPTAQLKLQQYWKDEAAAQDDAEKQAAGRAAVRVAMGAQPNEQDAMLIAKYRLQAPNDVWAQQQAQRDNNLVAPPGEVDPGPGFSLNPAQKRLMDTPQTALRPPPGLVNWLAANGVDVSSIAPKYERDTIYDPATGRERKAVIDMTDPTNVVNVGGVKAQDLPSEIDAVEYLTGNKIGGSGKSGMDMVGQYNQSKAARTNVTLNAPGQMDARWGKAPDGYGFVRDTNGEVMTEPVPGVAGGVRPIIAPFSGSKDDAARRAVEEKTGAATASRKQQANIVLDTINEARDMVGPGTTGAGGWFLRNIPGLEAYDLGAKLNTIRANVGFDKLQQMRDQSPTGGALGQVSEMENRLLQDSVASMDQSQSADQLRANLDRVQRVYNAIINEGPEAAMREFNRGMSGGQPEGGSSSGSSGNQRMKFNPDTGDIE